MSVISYYEPTPNRVRALTRLVALLQPATRSTLREHFMPEADSGGQFGNLIRETTSLGLIVDEQDQISLKSPLTPREVSDNEFFVSFVERALLTQEADTSGNSEFRYALSWLLSQPSGASIGWNSDQHRNMQAQMDGENLYEVSNKERFAMLCYWAQYLGYAAGLPIGGTAVVVPDPTEAIARHLERVFSEATQLDVGQFVERLGRGCPVLETGVARRTVEERMRAKRAANELSPASSLALWRLESRRKIRLTHASDATTWLMATTIASSDAGKSRQISHIELLQL
jgi:hypothetical protein